MRSVVCVSVLLWGCDPGERALDGSSTRDGGLFDARTMFDAGLTRDAGARSVEDGGARVDASHDGGDADASAFDGGAPDAGTSPRDGGAPDAGTSPRDGGAPDAGTSPRDSGAPDVGMADAGVIVELDGGARDSGLARDAGPRFDASGASFDGGGTTDTGGVSDGGSDGGSGPTGAWVCAADASHSTFIGPAGDVWRTVDCAGRGCNHGYCNRGPGVGGICATFRNGGTGTLVEGANGLYACPRALYGLYLWEFVQWLDAGDTIRIHADVASPSHTVTVGLSCGADAGPGCSGSGTTALGGSVTVSGTALRRTSTAVVFEVLPHPGTDGVPVHYRVEVIPAAPTWTPPPPLCTAGPSTCATPDSVAYCSADGLLRAHSCVDESTLAGSCLAGRCSAPRGETCADPVDLVRPVSGELYVSAAMAGVNDDFDPGTSCLDIGQTGADRMFRVSLAAGEHIRATVESCCQRGIYSLYLVRSCTARSCLTGAIGRREPIADPSGAFIGFTRVSPSIEYTAAAAETVYLVVDQEFGADPYSDSDYRALHVSWNESCTDGVRNGTETAIDCGGGCAPCPDGTDCEVNTDCASELCRMSPSGTTRGRCSRPACSCVASSASDPWCSACRAANCHDRIRNGDETSVDSGGYCLDEPFDTCRAAAVLPGPDPSEPSLWPVRTAGDLARAGDDRAPSCGSGGRDVAFRVYSASFGFRVAVTGTDRTAPISVSIASDCGGPEVGCATGVGTASLTVDLPGSAGYIVWVDSPVPQSFQLAIDEEF